MGEGAKRFLSFKGGCKKFALSLGFGIHDFLIL